MAFQVDTFQPDSFQVVPPFVVGTPTSVTGTGATTTALAWDAGTVAGDLLEMWVSQVGIQAITTTSLGLSSQQTRTNSPTNNASLTVLGKVLTAGDISAGTVTATFAASQPYVVTLVTVRNHNGLDAVGTGSSGVATTTVTVNAETPGVADTLVLGGVGGRVGTAATDATWTWPGPLVELTEVNSTGAGNHTYLTLAQQTEVGSPVASGPDTPVPSLAIAYAAFRISIRPAGAAPLSTEIPSLVSQYTGFF